MKTSLLAAMAAGPIVGSIFKNRVQYRRDIEYSRAVIICCRLRRNTKDYPQADMNKPSTTNTVRCVILMLIAKTKDSATPLWRAFEFKFCSHWHICICLKRKQNDGVFGILVSLCASCWLSQLTTPSPLLVINEILITRRFLSPQYRRDPLEATAAALETTLLRGAEASAQEAQVRLFERKEKTTVSRRIRWWFCSSLRRDYGNMQLNILH